MTSKPQHPSGTKELWSDATGKISEYPDGYRMEFVSAQDVKSHAGLMSAYKKNQRKGK